MSVPYLVLVPREPEGLRNDPPQEAIPPGPPCPLDHGYDGFLVCARCKQHEETARRLASA